jgi:hypothetical protein
MLRLCLHLVNKDTCGECESLRQDHETRKKAEKEVELYLKEFPDVTFSPAKMVQSEKACDGHVNYRKKMNALNRASYHRRKDALESSRLANLELVSGNGMTNGDVHYFNYRKEINALNRASYHKRNASRLGGKLSGKLSGDGMTCIPNGDVTGVLNFALAVKTNDVPSGVETNFALAVKTKDPESDEWSPDEHYQPSTVLDPESDEWSPDEHYQPSTVLCCICRMQVSTTSASYTSLGGGSFTCYDCT